MLMTDKANWIAGFRRLGINIHGVPIYSGVIRNEANRREHVWECRHTHPYAQWARDCAQKHISEKES